MKDMKKWIHVAVAASALMVLGLMPAAVAATAASVFHVAGSNAVAIGSAGTRNHAGMVLANPHFPWLGTERLYQAQLTIPGKLDVTGASLYGVPLILIGHTATVAWSHTNSTAKRFTVYQLRWRTRLPPTSRARPCTPTSGPSPGSPTPWPMQSSG